MGTTSSLYIIISPKRKKREIDKRVRYDNIVSREIRGEGNENKNDTTNRSTK